MSATLWIMTKSVLISRVDHETTRTAQAQTPERTVSLRIAIGNNRGTSNVKSATASRIMPPNVNTKSSRMDWLRTVTTEMKSDTCSMNDGRQVPKQGGCKVITSNLLRRVDVV